MNGNEVMVGGLAAGLVKEIELGDNGQALVTLHRRRRVRAAPPQARSRPSARARSRRSPGRQVQLTLPPAGADGDQGGEIEDGGTLTPGGDGLRGRPRRGLQHPRHEDGQGLQAGRSRAFATPTRESPKQANRGFHYSNPFLSTSRRVFAELTAGHPCLRVAHRRHREALGPARRAPTRTSRSLVGNANAALGAIGRQRAGAGRSDQPPARLHAPGEHDLREPPRGAHRPRSAGRGLEAGRRPALARSSRSSAPPRRTRCRRSATSQRSSAAVGKLERPGRADPRPGPACQGRGRLGDARLRLRPELRRSRPPQDDDFSQGALGETDLRPAELSSPRSPTSAPTPRSWSGGSTGSRRPARSTPAAGSVASRPPSTPFTVSDSGLVDLLDPLDTGHRRAAPGRRPRDARRRQPRPLPGRARA